MRHNKWLEEFVKNNRGKSFELDEIWESIPKKQARRLQIYNKRSLGQQLRGFGLKRKLIYSSPKRRVVTRYRF